MLTVEVNMSKGISKRTLEVFNLIRDVITSTSCAPTYDEIGIALSLTKSDAHYHVQILKEAGLLNSKYYSPRSIELRNDF